ncbi:hypothetical protein JR316_0001713 [Psilocybe cubensis]|uniref:F-box domain-containing protein n=2 Tax=Psilocybe cubensis TaxID=181762 RepID=A0A8H8CNS0_PSICU|nr:hypothetical protein JR316_0001713 [Psilocybe cubensis]KAH9484811.1 hypothetical protein JR316_0001713 [Psilocybe cubensis]
MQTSPLPKSIDMLLSSNVEPSEEEASKIQSLLVEPTRQLEELENNIRVLEIQLEDLKAKRTTTKETISRYRAVLSPIRRLPADVLREIFLHCLEKHRNPAMLASEAPMLLTRICSSWRSIAQSSPLLWAQIHIAFPNWIDFLVIEDSGDQSEHVPISQRRHLVTGKLFQLQFEAVVAWLSRSGTCPLSISIHYVASSIRSGYPAFPAENLNVISKLFKVLTDEADRWRHFELSIPKDAYDILVEALEGSPLPNNLVTLRVSFTPGGVEPSFSEPPNIIPSLRKISIDDIGHLTNGISRSRLQVLTFLSIHLQRLSTDVAAFVFKNCPSLIHVKFTILSWQQTPSETMPTIHLPELRTLYIGDDSPNLLSTRGFYDAFYAPKLSTLAFYSLSIGFYPSISPALTPNYPMTPISGLLQKSTRLHTLMLCVDNLSDKQLSEILHSASNITHLIYGKPTPPHRVSTFSPSEVPVLVDGYCETKWDFKSTFFETTGNIDSGSIPRTITPPLLPKLERIEFMESARVKALSNSTLLQFIINRMDPLPSGLISSLKEVKVNFNFHLKKKAEINVKESLIKLTQEMGISSNVHLSLTYSEYDYSPLRALGVYSEMWVHDRIDEDVSSPPI